MERTLSHPALRSASPEYMNHLASAEGRLPRPRQVLEIDRLDPQILLSTGSAASRSRKNSRTFSVWALTTPKKSTRREQKLPGLRVLESG